MSVTREELQEAGASPELARILSDRWPRRDAGDPARHPMAVALAGIVLAAFLSALGWLVLTVADTRTEVALLRKDVALLDGRMTVIEAQVTLLREGQVGLAERMTRIEDKLDRLLQQ